MGLPKPDLAAAEQRRHPRHVNPPIRIELDGKSYSTADWSAGGFLIAAYDGPCRPGDNALIDLIIPMPGRTHRTTVEVVIARISREDRQLAARFVRLPREATAALSELAGA
jgi:PilZ domain